MPIITFEQALFHRADHEMPALIARSAGFGDAWIAEAEHLILGFGDRIGGMRCPLAVFAKPMDAKHVAVVRAIDDSSKGNATGVFVRGLRFHFLIVDRANYEAWIRDPFILAERIEPAWQAADPVPTLTLMTESFVPRTLAQVRAVLKRVKASALREGEDPEAPDFERTIENSESPALLGGAQILVDGGRLVFERPEGDLPMVSGLWLLLPEATRMRLWPTSFAFGADLDFDVLVAPRLNDAVLERYTTEERAAEYPEGTYEVALQRAVEQGTQDELDAVFSRRDSHSTIRLALLILALVSLAVLASRWLDYWMPPARPIPVEQQQAAAAAGIVAAGEPWTALGMIVHGKSLWKGAEKPDEQK